MLWKEGLRELTNGKGRKPPKCLKDNRLDVWQICEVRKVGKPVVTNHPVNLLLSGHLDLWTTQQSNEEECCS